MSESTIMTWKRFVYQLSRIAASPTTYDNGKNWANWDGKRWHFDCVRLVKAVLWGFDFEKDKSHGGAVYRRGYPDYTTEQMIEHCADVKDDPVNAEPGEILWFKGHVGVCIGFGNVVECTPSLHGVAVTSVRYQSWKKRGKLPVIEYDTPSPAPAPKPVRREGEAVELNKEPLYRSSTRTEPANHVTGTYYLVDGKLINGRVRICNKPEDVGIVNRTIGYIDWRWD